MVITARTLSEGDHIFEGSLESTQKLIQDEGGVCEIIAGNVGDPDECAAIIDQVHDIFGPIYCLVNNAAVEWPMEAVELSPKRWQTTFNVCVHGPFYLSQICLRDDMGPAKSGRIINISSSAAIGPGFVGLGPAHEDETCYGACKAAVERMTQGLAAEVSADKYEGGIAVSCYAPSEVVCTALRAPPALPASSTPLQRRTGGVHLGQLRVHVPDEGAGLGRVDAPEGVVQQRVVVGQVARVVAVLAQVPQHGAEGGLDGHQLRRVPAEQRGPPSGGGARQGRPRLWRGAAGGAAVGGGWRGAASTHGGR